MITILSGLPTVPVILGGYVLLGIAALAGATVLGWDGAHLFLSDDASEPALHRRRYVTSVARGVAYIVGSLSALFAVVIALAAALLLT